VPADGNAPQLRTIHERRLEDDLRRYFSLQAGELDVEQLVFDHDRWDRTLATVLADRGRDTAADYATMIFELLDGPGQFDLDRLDGWVDEVATNSARRINDSTLSSLVDASLDGDPPAAADDLFDGLVTVRAGLYAVAAVTGTSNFGAHDGAAAAGGETKTWLTTSGKPRSAHSELAGEVAPLDARFSNGMRWPGDPAGGAENVANCVCALEFGP
jgi:hypothetical protein